MERPFPRGRVDLPAEDDPLPSVLVVGLEHETLALGGDEGHEVDCAAAVARAAFGHQARPGHVSVDGPALVVRKEVGVALVTQHSQARFLVQQLTAEWIHHAHGAGFDGTDHRVVAAAALHELTDEHAFVDQIYRSPGGDETPTHEVRVTRVDDHRLESARAEVIDPEHELIVRRHFAPIENRNPRGGALSAAPLLV